MIKTFKHKGLKKLFNTNDPSGIRQDLIPRIRRRLDALDSAENISELNFPGFDLYPLKGQKKGLWSIHINGPICITFRFEGNDVYDVHLENYH
ncbi:MAG: type II toxin-antitoxin system RelE/ParE family toxin [Nitrospiria bacterium]